MNRRTDKISGWVDFPVNDTTWTSTREGGMSVMLVVIDDRNPMPDINIDNTPEWEQCLCNNAYVILDESFIQDDHYNPIPRRTTADNLEKEMKDKDLRTEIHFPNCNDPRSRDQYLSVPYLFAAIIGTTGWSGADKDGNLWHCIFDDLTDEGQALYQMVQNLYTGCELYLLTFLDT